jgi:hypothetical protein
MYTGSVERCFWSYQYRRVSNADWSAFVASACTFIDRLGRDAVDGVGITLTYHAVPPEAMQRKELVDALIQAPSIRRLTGHALVTESRPVQLALKAMDLLARRPYPEDVFVDPYAALRWLSQRMPSLDPQSVVSSIVSGVPAHELDPRLLQAPADVAQLLQRRVR